MRPCAPSRAAAAGPAALPLAAQVGHGCKEYEKEGHCAAGNVLHPWVANGECDPGCDNAACGWDADDCVDGAFARLVKGSRRAAGPLGPLLLLLLLAVSVGLTLLWRDDLTEAYFGRAK